MAFRLLTNTTLRAIRPLSVPVSFRATVARPAVNLSVLHSVRTYAKKKDNKKDSKKATSRQNDSEDEVAKEPLFDEDQFEKRYEQCITSLKEHLSNIRVGRANPSLLDSVKVRIENTNFSLNDLAQVTVRDPQTLMVISHDEDYVASIDKAIRDAGLNLNPMIESKGIRVPIPKTTKETRDKMAKMVTSTGEQTKTKIRGIRQDGMKLLKEDKKHQSADDIKKLEKSVQNMTDKFNKTIDDLLKTKVKEIQL
ncbi:ribosome recycling factor domain-containing protein [Sporodiniella umbellata]|nr:ribosome recycling factor domain-containing protein [Sporodiniella umbellata]